MLLNLQELLPVLISLIFKKAVPNQNAACRISRKHGIPFQTVFSQMLYLNVESSVSKSLSCPKGGGQNQLQNTQLHNDRRATNEGGKRIYYSCIKGKTIKTRCSTLQPALQI